MDTVLNRKLAALAACTVAIGSLAFAGTAKAAPSYYNNIVLGRDAGACVDDPGNSGTAGDVLYLTFNCSLQGALFGPSASSYGSGFYSLVLKNTAHGQMCITDTGDYDGADLQLEGCNGSAGQAWTKFCSSAGVPSIVNAYGQALDLYGDHDTDGENIVSWHLYGGVSEEPEAEEWYGPWNTYC